MGAKGFLPLVVISLCAMIYRGRTQVRPETLAAVLLAAEIWLLESRRHGARVNPAWLVLVAWAWANTHISYYLFFVVLGIHLLAAHLAAAPAGDAARARAVAHGAGRGGDLVRESLGLAHAVAAVRILAGVAERAHLPDIGEMGPVDWPIHSRTACP